MKIEGEIRSGNMPENYVLLFERIVRVDGKLAKQQFWGLPEEGCNNTFAMKYEILEEEKDIFSLLKDLHAVMEEAKEALVEKERYEDAGDIKGLLEALQQLKNRRR